MAPLTLWLTDRTRYTTGTGQCAMARYLKTHFGPTGYGIVRKAESLPLMTGKWIHEALATIFGMMRTDDYLPSDEAIRSAINLANLGYQQQIAERGFAGVLSTTRSQEIVQEQQCLLTGLVWATVTNLLPWLHRNYKILQVEEESIFVLGCTCGIGEGKGSGEDHDQKGCQGIGLMLRQDLIAERRSDGALAYFEIKTTGSQTDTWSSAWETKLQLPIGSFGLEERFGKPLKECWILGLYKGYRKKVEVIGEGGLPETIKRQESPFCWAYCKPGNPPFSADEWVPQYEWVDGAGVTRRKSRLHEKRAVWELQGSDWEQVQGKQNPIEWWVREFLPASVLEKQVFLVGPMLPQAAQAEALKRQIVGEERRWQQVLWQLYEAQATGAAWSSPEFQALLQDLIPASWDCRKYGNDHQCEMIPICFKQEGWEDPLGTGKWVPRRPHHQPELDTAIARGLLSAEAGEGEEEE